MRSNTYYKLTAALFIGLLTCGVTTVKAQVSPLSSQYYQNQYLFNPAMAGLNSGFNVNVDYRKQQLGVNGSQNSQAASAEYQMDKVGLGVNLTNQLSGVFRQTRAMVTYAYHLPLSGDNQKLNFGLSAGVVDNHLNIDQVFGDQSDPTLANYNSKGTSFDGDFGVAYTSDKLTVQGALPNLRYLFKDNGSLQEREVFFTAVSYKFFDPANVSVEPKAAYRQVKGYDNIFDAGANVAFNNEQFSLQGFYHTSKSATFGVGYSFAAYSILGFYTTNTSSLNSYSSGDFEISLKINLSKLK
ncbi:type IX secretion system PorP/SprF family membrane protein [Mucilaginibacter gracilis]|uniref:Type IX secretion system PorP/SprF family membrane protein n=1 Tax=Mucilaginibacter gracilis TaxID=423350 RepID=A0A495J6E4_9SPHI|nr:PorP/SprF family type IX secretion system membrane protein [Mucilaginibacter gracilis]RKR84447.1 type IX secretion system PorP/SprF family membrane protein [Mucilaginibacter gracilis]